MVPEVAWPSAGTCGPRDTLATFTDSASPFLQGALEFDVATPTAADWIETLFKRTNILTRAAWTSLVRLAADLAGDFAQALLRQELVSVENPASAVAAGAWKSALPMCVRVQV